MKLGTRGWMIAKTAYSHIKYGIIKTISHSRILATLYFAISPTYRREQRALVSGLLTHMKDLKQDASFFLLRRNIHRIEKGLVMPHRRPLFAINYIGETVEYYVKCLKNCTDGLAVREFDWATDVLHQYFASVESHPYVKKSQTAFLKVAPTGKGTAVPYKRGAAQSSVPYEDLMALAYQRKSVRTFLKNRSPANWLTKP